MGRAVVEMDRVTQDNVALVADAAKAADRLEAQARTLRREMAVFNLTAEGEEAEPVEEGAPAPLPA